MAILSVTEEWRGLPVSQDVNSTTCNRRFMILFDNADEPVMRPIMALADPRVPAGFSPHPYNPWLCVVRRDISIEGPMDFIIDIGYSNRANFYLSEAPSSNYMNPLDEPAEIEFDTYEWNDYVDIDMTGKLIANTAEDTPDPPLQERMTCLAVRITRNQASFDAILMADYVNSTNSDMFWGFLPGICLCNRISARQMRQGGLIFYRATFEIFINPLKQISGHWVGGWMRRIVNEGFRYLDLGTQPITKKEAKDDDGNRVSQPVLLAANGTKLPLNSPNKVWLEFQTKREMPFSNLNL